MSSLSFEDILEMSVVESEDAGICSVEILFQFADTGGFVFDSPLEHVGNYSKLAVDNEKHVEFLPLRLNGGLQCPNLCSHSA